MKSLRIKLFTGISMFVVALALLIVGVWAVGETQHINLSGNVDFTISDNNLYIKDIRFRDAGSSEQGTTIDNFIPGFVKSSFELNLGSFDVDSDFDLIIDVVNTTTTIYEVNTSFDISNGLVAVSGRIEGDGVPLTEVSTADISGQIILNVTITSAGIVDLDQVDIPLTEYIPQVYDYFTFEVNDDGKTVTLTDYDSSLSDSTDVVIPSTVSQNSSGEWIEGNTYTVTAITDGSYNSGVFYDSGITSVTFPSSLTNIGAFAFDDCSKLTSISFPSSLTSIGDYAFNGCDGLTGELDLSSCTSLTSIGGNAFYYCSGLTSLTLPSSLTSIGDRVFNNCDSITKLEYLGTLEQWLAINMGSLWIDDTSHSLVINGESLRNLVVPDGITTIPQCAFYGCSFSNISLPSSLQSIENNVFNYCSYSTFEFRGTIEQWLLIEIGYNMTNDLTHTFIANGEEITNLVIPEGITIISNYAFTGCTNITNITMPSTLQSIDYWAFAYCRGITNIDFSACENLKTIENSAFFACSDQLSSLDLSNCKNLTNIGARAFEGCYALTDVNLIGCANLISIDRYAFSNCRGLTSVDLSGCTSLTSIGSDAFFYCIALESVVFPEGSTGWYVTQDETATSGTSVTVTDPSINADNLTGQYEAYYWKRG